MSQETVLPTTDLPVVNQKAVDLIFHLLEGMEVFLEENPLDYGPRRLNNKVAQARRMRNDTESLYLKVSHWLQKYRAAHRTSETLLELAKKDLMTNDIEVRSGQNIRDRDAIASIRMRSDVEEVARIGSVINDLVTLLAVIKAKRADLNDIQGRIRDQMKLCQEEIGLGGNWGSKPPPGSKDIDLDATPEVDKVTLKDLTDLFHGVKVDGKTLADVLRDDPEEPEEEVEPEEPEEEVEPEEPEEEVEPEEPEEPPVNPEEEVSLGDIPLEMFPQVGFCEGFDELCGEPQHMTTSGPSCSKGHGGAPTLTADELEMAASAEAEADPFGGSTAVLTTEVEAKVVTEVEAKVVTEVEAVAPDLEPEPPKSEAAETLEALLEGGTKNDKEADDFLDQLSVEKPEAPPERRKSKLDIDSILSDFGL